MFSLGLTRFCRNPLPALLCSPLPAGGSWRASRCSLNTEYYDANRETAGIEEGAQNDRYPLQSSTHSAARKGQWLSQADRAWPVPGRLVLQGNLRVDRRTYRSTRFSRSKLTITSEKGALRGLPVQPPVPFFHALRRREMNGSIKDKGSRAVERRHPEPIVSNRFRAATASKLYINSYIRPYIPYI